MQFLYLLNILPYLSKYHFYMSKWVLPKGFRCVQQKKKKVLDVFEFLNDIHKFFKIYECLIYKTKYSKVHH